MPRISAYQSQIATTPNGNANTNWPLRDLVIKNSAGDVLFESGTPNSDGFLTVDTDQAAEKCIVIVKTGSYIEDECFSKHKNIITRPGEIAIYETVMGDTNNQVTYVLLHGDRYLKDNRIPPAGFSQTDPRFSSDVAVIGAAAADPDFNRDDVGVEGTGIDSIHYVLDWTANPSNNMSIEAILYYQTIKPAFVTGLHNRGDKIDSFKWMYSQKKPQPINLANDQQVF